MIKKITIDGKMLLTDTNARKTFEFTKFYTFEYKKFGYKGLIYLCLVINKYPILYR